ncbi:hypothetical protein [Rhodobacter maris]|uniref:Uncharacterized protein n=1 Tax=Rhodobacter maris TaxID=446682 RepID=A0A285RJA1_9RHOB|nr:hypothetical protein [Rhodobacter maris]SOB93954.1 hypothetical protein SAMN05877831_101289 [Rhodobacter maris]
MMSETETNIEIEDVLASIRRLVSRDAPRAAGATTHRSALAVARRPLPEEIAPDLAPGAALSGVLLAERPVSEAPVSEMIMPAMPVPEAPAPEAAALEASALMDAPADPDLSDAAPAEVAPVVAPQAEEIEETGAAMNLAGPALSEPAETDAEPEAEADAKPEAEADAEIEMAAESDEIADDDGADDESAEAVTAPPAPDHFLVLTPSLRVEAAPEAARPMTEAEQLLAEAEAALAETGAVLEDASSALDAEAAAPEEEPEAGPLDLGDELSRLENTIAELEAAVAESGIDFEPEEGHPFVAEGAAPLTELPEAFDEEVLQVSAQPEPEDADLAAVVDDLPTETEAEAMLVALAEQTAAEEEAQAAWAVEESAEEAAVTTEELEVEAVETEELEIEDCAAEADAETEGCVDPDLRDAAWGAETSVGMDWAEATLNLARGAAGPLHALEEAEVLDQQVTDPSHYDDLDESLEADGSDEIYAEVEAEIAAEAECAREIAEEQTLSEATLSVDEITAEEIAADPPTHEAEPAPAAIAPRLDEAALRAMVGQLVREELRGTLGERITQNVRKLVRREIQRALTGQAYD